jgi:hypothetical protein
VTLYATDELTALRDCAESLMDDACQLGTVSLTTSATGADVAAFTYAAETACGIQTLSGGERAEYRDGAMTVVQADAKLRLPLDAVVTKTSRVKLTRRHGTAIAAEYYEVHGEPATGTTAIVCYLRRVTT